jgi:hypothetical protein
MFYLGNIKYLKNLKKTFIKYLAAYIMTNYYIQNIY